VSGAPSMIEIATADGVARITLNRPEKRNALELGDLHAFSEALVQLRAEAPRALIVTGAGDKAFCAGVSLGDVGGDVWVENPLTALCDALQDFPCPTVAALNGGVYGGGAEIALSCDFRIGVTGMKCFVPPARLGIHYEPQGIARAVAVVGAQAARRMFLAVETFDDAALERIGFVDRLVAPESLAAVAEAYAAGLAALAPMAVQGMKRTINELARGELDAEAARARIAACWASEDLREGLAAMREKRTPSFKGR
jgi:enoyl-CoA hydratase/carnithine racemase